MKYTLQHLLYATTTVLLILASLGIVVLSLVVFGRMQPP